MSTLKPIDTQEINFFTINDDRALLMETQKAAQALIDSTGDSLCQTMLSAMIAQRYLFNMINDFSLYSLMIGTDAVSLSDFLDKNQNGDAQILNKLILPKFTSIENGLKLEFVCLNGYRDDQYCTFMFNTIGNVNFDFQALKFSNQDCRSLNNDPNLELFRFMHKDLLMYASYNNTAIGRIKINNIKFKDDAAQMDFDALKLWSDQYASSICGA